MPSQPEPSARRTKLIAIFLSLSAAGRLSYEAWNYCGIYRLVLEFELSRNGGYAPKVGLAFATIAYAGLVGLALAIGVRLRLIEGSTEDLVKFRRKLAAFTSQITRHKYRLAFLIAGVALVFSGIADIAMARLAGDLTPYSLAKLESGGSPPGRWLELEGKPLPEAAVSLTENRRQRGEYYYPFVSTDWKEGSPIGVILLYDTPVEGGTTKVQAMIGLKRLPGVVRAEMEKLGYHFAPSVFVIEATKTPDDFWLKGIGMLAMGLLVLVGNAFAWWWKRASPI